LIQARTYHSFAEWLADTDGTTTMVTPVIKNCTTKVSTDDLINIMCKINLILLAVILFGVCIAICISGVSWCKRNYQHQVILKFSLIQYFVIFNPNYFSFYVVDPKILNHPQTVSFFNLFSNIQFCLSIGTANNLCEVAFACKICPTSTNE
jgi:hypothetical protein